MPANVGHCESVVNHYANFIKIPLFTTCVLQTQRSLLHLTWKLVSDIDGVESLYRLKMFKRKPQKDNIPSQALKRQRMHATSPPRAVTFLDLPLKVRNAIYNIILEPTARGPIHPIDETPPLSRFKAWTALFLVNRQVKKETEDLFRAEYEERVRFYFENTPTLYNFIKRWKRHHLIADVHFSLWTTLDLMGPDPDALNTNVEDVIRNQPGFK